MGHRLEGQKWSGDFDPYSQWDLVDNENMQMCEPGTYMQCVCTNRIKRFHKVKHIESGMCIAVGTTCIKKYFGSDMYEKAHQQELDFDKPTCAGPGCTAKLDRRTTLGKAGVCSNSCFDAFERSQWPLCTVCHQQPVNPAHNIAGTCSNKCLAAIWQPCRDCSTLIRPHPYKVRCLGCYQEFQEVSHRRHTQRVRSDDNIHSVKRAKKSCIDCGSALPPDNEHWKIRCLACFRTHQPTPRPAGGAAGSKRCFRCKQLGHFSRNCPH